MSNGIDQYVYLIPQRDTNNNMTGWMWVYKGQFGTGALPSISANNGQNNLTFTVVDPKSAIKFDGYQTSDINKALWISPKGSPTAKQSGIYVDNKKDFDSLSLQPGGTQLVMSDVNGKKLDFVYQLNFVDSANNNQGVKAIDPEIKNGDGSPFFSAAAIYVGIALATAMLTLMFVRFALGWRRVA